MKSHLSKLQIDYNYLTQDVYEQIKSNIENIKTNNYSLEKLDKMIGYNLEYSCKHNYNDLALELIHILFEVYIQNNKLEKIQLIISKYYELYQGSKDNEEIIIYYNDMARFFMKTGEYHEAISYYSRIRDVFEKEELSYNDKYIYACFYEGICYKNINLIEKSYDCLKKVINYTEKFKTDKDKGDYYHELLIYYYIRLKRKNI